MFLSTLFKRKKDVRERRRHYRNPLRNLVSIDAPERSIYNVSDISQGGLQFSSSKRFPHNEFLNLTVNLFQAGTQIQALGKVAWTHGELRSGSKAYQIGVQFFMKSSNISNNIKTELLSFAYV